jgi:hypothetical protein
VLPLLNAGGGHVELLDLPKLRAQLCGLERKTARGGRDSVDHAPRQHDDVSNAVCGAILLAHGRQAVAVMPIGIEKVSEFRQPDYNEGPNWFSPWR